MTATTMHGDHVIISDEQFSKLVELLTPGYECSKLMLAELAHRDAERQRYEAERQHPTPPVGTEQTSDPELPLEEVGLPAQGDTDAANPNLPLEPAASVGHEGT